jgi:hypothetical protein
MSNAAIDVAKRRFFMLQGMRLFGMVLVVCGLLLWRTTELVSPPNPLAGKILFGIGAFIMLVVPVMVLRQWRRTAKTP